MTQPAVNAGIDARDRQQVLPPEFTSRIWKPGQSGNPGGRTGRFVEVQALARDKSIEAMQTIVELMRDPDPKIAGWAADKVLERAWGKPKEYDPRAESPETPPIDPAQFTDKQRAMLRQMLTLLLNAAPVEDATK